MTLLPFFSARAMSWYFSMQEFNIGEYARAAAADHHAPHRAGTFPEPSAKIAATDAALGCHKGMDRTSTHLVDQSASQPALDPHELPGGGASHGDASARRGAPPKVNLRPLLWRSRAAFVALFLIAGISYVGFMTFGSGSVAAATPDPAVVQAEAEAHLARNVAKALEAARPADQPLALPRSKHAKGGLLLPMRLSVAGH